MSSASVANVTATEPHRRAGRRVLVAEDSAITHDLLKLLLNQRGHHVDVANDGLKALEALRNSTYDVALLDYHLPHMDGLEVATAIKDGAQGRPLPRLIAITADPEGLLSAGGAGCETFDYILPKPLDINQVGKVVEEQAEMADKAASAVPPLPRPVVAMVRPSSTLLDGLGHNVLYWPDDLNAARLSNRAMQATLGDALFDAIAVKTPASQDDLAIIWQRKALYALPIVDLTGSLGSMADLNASKLSADETDQVERLIRGFKERRSHLHRDLLLSEELEDRVLGRVFVSGMPLTAKLNPGVPACFCYNLTLNGETATAQAEQLYERGLMERDFVERFHVCGRCNSDRMHVRDVCSKCQSANLVEELYLRHYPCGFQAPKSEFRRGLRLICPKCQGELMEFGVDYDRVARLIICQSCGFSDSKAELGMICLDCSAHYAWDTCQSRDAFSYRLTDQGTGYAEYGRSFLGLFQKPLRFEELPRELVLALNDAAKAYNANKAPFTLINIFYKNERRITSEQGSRAFAEARDQFIENLRAALGGTKLVVKGPSSYDFALMPGISPHRAEKEFATLRGRAAAALPFDLGATLKAFGPEDF